MFGDGIPGGSFGVYHLWVTQTNATRWANLSDLSNEGNDCTFVNGTRVIYNLQARFAGSPYHQEFNTPTGNLCHYKFEFNDDDQFLGATDFNKIHQPGNGPRPARLVVGAEAGSVVAVEVLVELEIIAPVRIVLELLRAAINGASAVLVLEKHVREPA